MEDVPRIPDDASIFACVKNLGDLFKIAKSFSDAIIDHEALIDIFSDDDDVRKYKAMLNDGNVIKVLHAVYNACVIDSTIYEKFNRMNVDTDKLNIPCDEDLQPLEYDFTSLNAPEVPNKLTLLQGVKILIDIWEIVMETSQCIIEPECSLIFFDPEDDTKDQEEEEDTQKARELKRSVRLDRALLHDDNVLIVLHAIYDACVKDEVIRFKMDKMTVNSLLQVTKPERAPVEVMDLC